ncbi:MAG TPA: hypothetical protein VH540_11485 [Ktedonobacterales bacterium]
MLGNSSPLFEGRRFSAPFMYACVSGFGLLVSVLTLEISHHVALGNPAILLYALVLMLPAILTVLSPDAGLIAVLMAALLSWAIPALIPQLSAFSADTTFAVAVLTAWVGLLFRTWFYRERLSATFLRWPLVAFSLWVLLSFGWNYWHVPAGRSIFVTGLKGLLTTAAFFLFAANALRTEGALRRYLLVIVFASVPLSLVAYLQYGWLYFGLRYSTIHPALDTLAAHVTFGVRLAGTLSDAGILSFYYLVAVSLAVMFLCLPATGRRMRIALWCTILFDVWPFLVTFTKSTLVVAFLALLVLAWMRRSWRVALGTVVISAAGWAALTFIPFSSILANLGANALGYGLQQDGDLTQRLQFMRQCAGAIPGHALLGVGPLGSELVTGVHCHSLPIEVATDFGLVGFAIFGWLLWRLGVLCWRARLERPGTLLEGLGQTNIALLVGFGILAFVWPLINFTLPWFLSIEAVIVGGFLYPRSRQAGLPGASQALPTAQQGETENIARVPAGARSAASLAGAKNAGPGEGEPSFAPSTQESAPES